MGVMDNILLLCCGAIGVFSRVTVEVESSYIVLASGSAGLSPPTPYPGFKPSGVFTPPALLMSNGTFSFNTPFRIRYVMADRSSGVNSFLFGRVLRAASGFRDDGVARMFAPRALRDEAVSPRICLRRLSFEGETRKDSSIENVERPLC
ncbi:hypothetical protein M501DRAFT_290200 [Patellaria atrata CBS 101060]|uniref:Secreted protein n=1 Tax=Patellaria atrata CBS 101060 TaxID=1346257 RepID=A0A9P4S3W0_9PEZI|nr:hypothetical protein M501DRAFT_290200 [Patellaria atrata CBS 101060]